MRIVPAFAALLLLPACGGGDSGGTPQPAPPANAAPTFTSASTASVPENKSEAYSATATDADGDPLTFSIAGGADAARFTILSQGALRFATPPNFEAPADADQDNVYVVQLQVSDGKATAQKTVEITVTNDGEGIAVRRVGTGFAQPLYVAPIPGDTKVWVLEKTGQIMIFDPATGSKTMFMSVRQRRDPISGAMLDDFTSDGQRGLLGILAQSDYETSGYFYVYMTNAGGDIEVRRYRRGADGRGDPRDFVLTLFIEHSQFDNHYGGWMGYGADGQDIYIATGDGGGSGDPQNNAQNTHSLLGKILRVRPNPDPFAGAAPNYSFVPAPGNPFLGGGGDPRVFAYGLRNPHRASFHDGQLLIGDVGENSVEEIDLLRPSQDAGANYGWPFREGTRAFQGSPPAGLVDPVTQYLHGTGPREGRAVIGGYVYQGPIQSLSGQYVFADYVSGNIWTVPFQSLQQGTVLAASSYERRNQDFVPDAGTIHQIVSFGKDAAGNLYIVDFDGEIFLVAAG